MKLIYENQSNDTTYRVCVIGKSRTNYSNRILIHTKIIMEDEIWETVERYNANLRYDINGKLRLDKQAKPYKTYTSIIPRK